MLVAVNFQYDLEESVLQKKEFTVPQDYRLQSFSSFKRIEGINQFVAGGFRHILVIHFHTESFLSKKGQYKSQQTFEIVGVVENAHTHFISDVCFYRNTIFSVCSHDDYASIVKVVDTQT